MELRHLRYFVAVAEELSFSRAAARVYLSQPALSQQIGRLEEELGIELLRRSKRRVELTEAGRALLEGGREALVHVDQAVRTAREVGGAERSLLRVGFPEYANHTIVARILDIFQRRNPQIVLEQHELFTLQDTLSQVGQLRGGELDVGFMLLPIGDDTLETRFILRIELLAALPQGHPLARLEKVPMHRLAGERLILFSRRFHPGCYDYVVGCCREAGFTPDMVHNREPQLYSSATTYRMVASGMGVGIVARPVVTESLPEGVVFRPLTEPSPGLDLVAAWRRGDPLRTLRTFLKVMDEVLDGEERGLPEAAAG